MTPSQRFLQLISPALILMGFFFGFAGFLLVGVPGFAIYQGHIRGWSVWGMAWRAASGLFGLLWLHSVFI